MKFAGICFLIGLLVFFLWSRKNKKGEKKEKPVGKKEGDGQKNKIWKKKSLYIWLFIFQFVVLNFVYPGGWFEVKTIFWFFATRNSDKFVAVKEINKIVEKDEKQKISSIREKIKEIKEKTELTDKDKVKLRELANEVINVGKPKRQKALVEKPAPKPTTKMAWVLRLDGSSNHQSSDFVEVDENSMITITEKEIAFSYYKRNKKHDVWLVREKTDEFYHGVLNLSDGTKQDLYLLGGGEKFSGYIQQINGDGKSKKAFLRKEEVMIKK